MTAEQQAVLMANGTKVKNKCYEAVVTATLNKHDTYIDDGVVKPLTATVIKKARSRYGVYMLFKMHQRLG